MKLLLVRILKWTLKIINVLIVWIPYVIDILDNKENDLADKKAVKKINKTKK